MPVYARLIIQATFYYAWSRHPIKFHSPSNKQWSRSRISARSRFPWFLYQFILIVLVVFFLNCVFSLSLFFSSPSLNRLQHFSFENNFIYKNEIIKIKINIKIIIYRRLFRFHLEENDTNVFNNSSNI